MKEQMKRTVYEAPETKLFRIELEGGFMAGSADIENPNTETGKIDDHEINQDFNSNNFTSGVWE